jgi:putative transposase
VAITIAGKKHWLWRAVDQDGYVLDEIVQARRNTKAARRLDQAVEEAGPRAEAHDHRQAAFLWGSKAAGHAGRRASIHKGLNNRAENSHVPLRKREWMMQGFPSARIAATFRLNLFRRPQSLRSARSKCSAFQIHLHRLNAMAEWKAVTG